MTEYTPPGVRNITEVNSPSITTVLDRPTVIALVGMGKGNQSLSETIVLSDNTAQPLTGINVTTTPISTVRVVDAVNKNTVYTANSDYEVSTDSTTKITSIKRKIYTSIPASQDVVLICKTTGGSPSGAVFTNAFTLSNTVSGPVNGDLSTGLECTNGGTASIGTTYLQTAGKYVVGSGSDYVVSVTSTTATVARSASSRIATGQTVYVSYTTNDGAAAHSETITMSSTTAFHLASEAAGVDEDSIVIKNTIANVYDNIVQYSGDDVANETATSDYLVDVGTLHAHSAVSVKRNTMGPTTMNVDSNRSQVVVSYDYIPFEYYYPTRMTSISDVEAKYGSAIDDDGTVGTPLSFAAMMAFGNGANEVYCQALYQESTTGGTTSRIGGDELNTAHWDISIGALESLEDINVIIPVPSVAVSKAGDGDAISLNIINKVVNYISKLNLSGQYAIGIFGEDGSYDSSKADQATLRSHATTLSGSTHPERNILISPSSFTTPNFKNGANSVNIGGQYVAAAIAGMLGARTIQTPLTRKSVLGITNVNVTKTETDKNQDAGSGLFVIENKNGVVRVRHAITTERNNQYLREVSAVRAKFFMIESVRTTIDSQLIGQIIADERAPFTVATTVQGVLELLKSSGTLIDYGNINAASLAGQPTAISVRWSYSLPYPLNYVDITMSLDTVTGSIAVQ